MIIMPAALLAMMRRMPGSSSTRSMQKEKESIAIVGTLSLTQKDTSKQET